MTYEAALLQQQTQVQIDWLGVAAAVAGAVVAGAMGFRSGSPPRQWTTSMIVGVAAGVFCGPYVAETVGLVSTKASMFAHFTVGLLGYQLVDKVADKALAFILSKLPHTPPAPDAPKG